MHVKKYIQFINEATDNMVYYHGSTDKDMNGKNGIHIGTELSARECLYGRIGVPVEGDWDGTRKYGETMIKGMKSLKKLYDENRIFYIFGFNCKAPEEDYYPSDREERACYSDRTPVPLDCKPVIFPVRIIGRMSNTRYNPHPDFKANGYMMRALRKGNAKSGYYYINEVEDSGSISAVVPNKTFLEVL